jgi:hypothetical protein
MNTETTNQLDERLKILKMVEEGKVSPGEGAELLSALGKDRKARQPEKRPFSGGTRFFRVRVTDLVSGRSKATVCIPLSLMDWGLRIGAQFAPEIGDVDLQELSEVLQSGAEGKIVDVIDDEDGEHVEIYID